MWQEAEKIIASYHCQKYVQSLLDYWESHPPTLGHGLSHILRVVTKIEKIGKTNQFPDIQSLIIGALYHDIYRPAEAKDGEDDQTPGAVISEQILTSLNTPQKTVDVIKDALISHDSWRSQPDAPLFSVILSLADKAAHNPTIVYGYAWASNKQIGKPVYDSHLQAIYAFSKYQLRAWEVIYKHQIPGYELAAQAYITIFDYITKQYYSDPNNQNFFQHLNQIAYTYREEEQAALQVYLPSKTVIRRVMNLCQ
jgi:hypothetical protein